MNVKVTFLISFIVFSSQLFASCFVVSGQKKDYNGFLENRPILSPSQSMIAGQKCKVVNGWEELESEIKLNSKKGSKLLILHASHSEISDEGTSFSCNSGKISPSQVGRILDDLSQDYDVAAIIHSCFSGEVMRDKLLKDEGRVKGISRLCLLTSSSPKRVTYSGQRDILELLSKSKRGETLEDVFLRADYGMISSAAWSEIGLPLYLRNKNLMYGMNALYSLDRITRADGKCDNLGKVNSTLCAASDISDVVYQNLMYFLDARIFLKEQISLHNILKNGVEKASSKNQSNCFKLIKASYEKKFGPQLERLLKLEQLDAISERLKTTNSYKKYCVPYERDLIRKEQIDKNEKGSVTLQNFFYAIKERKNRIEDLKKKYTKINFEEKFDLFGFAKGIANKSGQCDVESKKRIIESLFGEDFFSGYVGEYNKNLNEVADSGIEGVSVSTQYALKEFQNASIKMPKMRSETDQIRRDACRRFKL